MKYSTTILLAAAAGQATAGAISHQHARGKVHNHALRHAEIKAEAHLGKRSIFGTDGTATGFISGKGAKLGANSQAPTSNAWLGAGGAYQNEFINNSGEDLVLFCWGPAGSWINAVQPLISSAIPAGGNLTVSYAEGASGACAPVFPDTAMVNGQVFNTWLEYTFAGIYSTYDVSREVNMNGRGISTTGPGCTTDMNTCVFMCADKSAPSCWYGYELINCHAGNGGGSGSDPYTGAPAGGCNGLTGGSGKLVTNLY